MKHLPSLKRVSTRFTGIVPMIVSLFLPLFMSLAWPLILSVGLTGCQSSPKEAAPKTYCNPIDISYRFCLDEPSRREAADPTMILFKGQYYLFPSKSGGYYISSDLADWTFLATDQIPVEEYAPTVVAIGDTMYFLASSESKSTVYKSGDPASGTWSVAVEALQQPVWDPALFLDEDNRLYLYWGCSNRMPTYGVEVDYKNNFKFIGEIQSLVYPNPAEHGWEVPGDYNTIERAPWIEGSWMTKVNGNYYLQYAGPGTEFKSYTDGVYVSNAPLGPFTLQATNPFAYKPEGFVAGGGHGSSFEDLVGNRWQIGAVSIGVKHMFERRLALFPVFCDAEGTLWANTKYGDYPTYIPQSKDTDPADYFTGWMLLSYRKPVTVSSALDSCPAVNMTDEDIRTYWAATSGKAGESVVLNLEDTCDVYAVQLNFAEDNTRIFGRQKGIYHRYTLETSEDGQNWTMLVDKSTSETDNSHQYMELDQTVSCQYLKLTNVQVPDGHFALSGFRVFGKGHGVKPGLIDRFTATREKDRRKVTLAWNKADGATGYVISYGVAQDKPYLHYMVYSDTTLTINSLNTGQPYYFSIEAFNENGITESSQKQAIE